MNKYLLFLFCLLTLLSSALFANSDGLTKKSEALQQLYRAEYQSWIEYIERYQNPIPKSNFDVTFYHISVDIAVHTPYIRGSVICNFKAVENDSKRL